MRLLVFTTLFPSDVERGRGTFIRSRVMALREAGATVRVVAPVPWFPFKKGCGRWSRAAQVSRTRQEDGIPVHHPRGFLLPRVGMRYYGAWMARGARPVVEQILERFPVDLVDAHFLYPDGYAALRICQGLELPMVVTARGTDAHTYPKMPFLRSRLQAVLQGARRVFAVSESLAQDLTPCLPPGRKIVVTPNGVDTDLFRPLERVAARRRLGLDEKAFLLLGVGRLVPVKRWDLAVDAVAHLLGKNPGLPLNLCLLGEGKEREDLERRITAAGLGSRVRLVGERSQFELPVWLSAADALVHPSEREGWPNVILEALACGTPVVGRAIPSIAEVAPPPGFSRLVEDPTAETLARAIAETLEESHDRDALVERALEYSWPRIARRILAELKKVHEHPVSP